MPIAPAIRFMANNILQAAQIGDEIWGERRVDDPAIAYCIIDEESRRVVHTGGRSAPSRATSGLAT